MSQARQDLDTHDDAVIKRGATNPSDSNVNNDSTTRGSTISNPDHNGDERASDPEEGVARLTVSIPKGLYRRFRLHALDNDITLSALLAQMIRKELS